MTEYKFFIGLGIILMLIVSVSIITFMDHKKQNEFCNSKGFDDALFSSISNGWYCVNYDSWGHENNTRYYNLKYIDGD